MNPPPLHPRQIDFQLRRNVFWVSCFCRRRPLFPFLFTNTFGCPFWPFRVSRPLSVWPFASEPKKIPPICSTFSLSHPLTQLPNWFAFAFFRLPPDFLISWSAVTPQQTCPCLDLTLLFTVSHDSICIPLIPSFHPPPPFLLPRTAPKIMTSSFCVFVLQY